MDMSDKIVAGEADELAHDRELLKAEGRRHRSAQFAQLAGYSVGHKLKLMFGMAAGAAMLLGLVALVGLSSGGGGTTNGLLLTMTVIAVVVATIAGVSIRFVRNELVRPLEEV